MRFIIFLILMFSVSPIFADVTAEVLSYKIDQNGNIEVHTQYKVDGIEVQSRYPQENGKYYWVTRYDSHNFGDMNDEQIKQRILADVESQSESLIAQTFKKKENQKIVDGKLGTLVGAKITKTQAEVSVDNDGDNKADEVWTVDTEEKISEKAITIIP